MRSILNAEETLMRPKVIDAPEDIWLGYSIIDDSGHD